MLETLFGTPPSTIVPGQVEFAVGATSWTVPAGVTSISAVVVGGGSRGQYSGGYVYGGQGGALRWLNDIPVTPGEVLTIAVGGGAGAVAYTTGNVVGATGGNSSIKRGATVLLQASGGKITTANDNQVADCINGTGGYGGPLVSDNGVAVGSGAGGYSGNGGGSTANNVPSDTSAGASGTVSSTVGGNGGGASVYGTDGPTTTKYGNGGGGLRRSTDGAKSYNAAVRGAVRIMWGRGRSYPSNAIDVTV